MPHQHLQYPWWWLKLFLQQPTRDVKRSFFQYFSLFVFSLLVGMSVCLSVGYKKQGNQLSSKTTNNTYNFLFIFYSRVLFDWPFSCNIFFQYAGRIHNYYIYLFVTILFSIFILFFLLLFKATIKFIIFYFFYLQII